MKSTETGSGMLPTLEECTQMTFLQPNAGASDFHARTSVSQENKSDFMETVQACFSELCTFLDSSKKKRDPINVFINCVLINLDIVDFCNHLIICYCFNMGWQYYESSYYWC